MTPSSEQLISQLFNLAERLQTEKHYRESVLVTSVVMGVQAIFAKLEECLPSTPSSSTTGKSGPSPSPAPSSSSPDTPYSSTPAGAD